MGIQQELEKANEEFNALVETEQRNGSKFITFEGILLTKPCVKRLRGVIESISRLLNA